MTAKILRISQLVLPILLAPLMIPTCLSAQSQSNSGQSVADAARRAREKEKKESKPIKVITNDDLERLRNPGSTPEISTATATQAGAPPGAPAAEASAAQAPAGAAATSSTSASDKAEKEKRAAELADLKKKLADAQSDLDLLQRQLALQRDTFYSNPDYVHDTAGQAQLNQLKQQISDKQQVVDGLKSRVSELQKLVGTTPSTEKSGTSPQS
jgi:hypothetical protein